MWSYYLNQEFGDKIARKILNAHENNPKQAPKEKEMDTHNNEVSIRDSVLNKSKNITPEQALEKFKENIKNKKLKVVKPKYSDTGGLP